MGKKQNATEIADGLLEVGVIGAALHGGFDDGVDARDVHDVDLDAACSPGVGGGDAAIVQTIRQN